MAHATLDRFAPDRGTLLVGALLFNTGLLLAAVYFVFTDATLLDPRFTLYGIVWITVGALVFRLIDLPPASTSTRRRALAVSVGYFGLLAVAGGLVSAAPAGGGMGLRLAWLPPGWGPALLYSGEFVNVTLMPARVIGYLALAYLVYATVLDAAGAAAPGLLGLLSCVSCSWPILASLATGAFGSGTALAAATTTLSYDLSTAVFLLTVGLLYWRPLSR